MTAVSKSTFIIFGDQKKQELLSRDNKERYAVSLYPVKVQSQPAV
jgi:hypothetical protein